MPRSSLRRPIALVAAAALLASLAAATVAAPASAAKPECFGKTATIVGTNKGERIVGTPKRDVIVAKGGADRTFGRGGNDLICAGDGNDRVVGNAGIDKLIGGRGADRMFGGPGPDRLFGGPGPDTIAGQPGNDVIDGGIGIDTCYQGIGTGPVVRCERPPVAPTPSPPGPSLIPLTGILAVAYSDIDGLDGYSTGDVLIARLRDTDGNGPDAGDVIEMDRYPTNLAGSAFADWGVKSHEVAGIVGSPTADKVTVTSTTGHDHLWFRLNLVEGYEDGAGGSTPSWVRDGLSNVAVAVPVENDQVYVQIGSPSSPQTPVSGTSVSRVGDDAFIDVVLTYSVP